MPGSPESRETNTSPFVLEWQSFCAALLFLTRLPFPSAIYSPTTMARAVIYFPLVGLVVALIGGSAFHLATLLWSPPIAVVLALAAMALCTGALHEDGLADSADGIGGGWTIEDKLKIMKDSRIGTYGGLTLILAMLLKVAALCAIPASEMLATLISAHVLARWSILPLLHYCPYIGGGTGNPFAEAVDRKRLLTGSVISGLVVIFFAPDQALALIVIAILMSYFCSCYFKRTLGGITGDTLGAANQLIEIAVFLTAAAWYTS